MRTRPTPYSRVRLLRPLDQKTKTKRQQGRIHGNPVADDWAGAVMRKPLGIKKCDGQTDGPTYRPTYRPIWQGVESRVRD